MRDMHSRWTGTWGFVILSLAACSDSSSAGDEASENHGSVEQALIRGVNVFARVSASGGLAAGGFHNPFGPVTAARSGVGRYAVTFANAGVSPPTAAGRGGNVQVVAVGPDNVRCALRSAWATRLDGSVTTPVVCTDPSGSPADSGFFVQFVRTNGLASPGAYAVVSGTGALATAPFLFESGAGAIAAARRAGIARGAYLVELPSADHPDDERGALQLSAVSSSGVHCKVSGRSHVAGVERVSVDCYGTTGLREDAAFSISLGAPLTSALYGVGAYSGLTSGGGIRSLFTDDMCLVGNTRSSVAAVGVRHIDHPGLGDAQAVPHVVASGISSGYCKVTELTAAPIAEGARVTTSCFDIAGMPLNEGLFETYSTAWSPGDSRICGGCAAGCGGCSLGMCLPKRLASETKPTSVAINDDDVYWTSIQPVINDGPILLSVPKVGGAVQTLLSATPRLVAFSNSVALNDSYVFWTMKFVGSYEVWRKPLAGGAASMLFSSTFPVTQPRSLVTSGEDVYWSHAGVSQLYRITPAGTATSLVHQPALFFYPFTAVIADTHAFFVRDEPRDLYRVPLGDVASVPELLSSVPGFGLGENAIASDGVRVFWASSFAPGAVMSVPVGGGATTTLTVAPCTITGMAVHGGDIFWVCKDPGKVMRMPVWGGAPVTLASGQNDPNSIAVDAESVVWTNADAVMSLPR
jgi:hypothetical protein